jgi:hypothetical protein
MLLVKRWFRNRREARFHSQKGRVSYPPGKAPGLLTGRLAASAVRCRQTILERASRRRRRPDPFDRVAFSAPPGESVPSWPDGRSHTSGTAGAAQAALPRRSAELAHPAPSRSVLRKRRRHGFGPDLVGPDPRRSASGHRRGRKRRLLRRHVVAGVAGLRWGDDAQRGDRSSAPTMSTPMADHDVNIPIARAERVGRDGVDLTLSAVATYRKVHGGDVVLH